MFVYLVYSSSTGNIMTLGSFSETFYIQIWSQAGKIQQLVPNWSLSLLKQELATISF